MGDSDLHKAIETSRLNEMDRCVAVAAMERAELFASAVMWVERGIRKLSSGPLPKRAPSYQEHALEGRSF